MGYYIHKSLQSSSLFQTQRFTRLLGGVYFIGLCVTGIKSHHWWRLQRSFNTWDSADDVVESEEGAEIEEWLRENSATSGNSGDSTLRHATTRKRSAVDLSIHMGDIIISDWRIIPALGFCDHTTIAFNVRRDHIANSGERARQRTSKRETKFCYGKADWKEFNRQFDNAYRNFVDSPRENAK